MSDPIITQLGTLNAVGQGYPVASKSGGSHTVTVSLSGTGALAFGGALLGSNDNKNWSVAASLSASGNGSAVGQAQLTSDFAFWALSATTLTGTGVVATGVLSTEASGSDIGNVAAVLAASAVQKKWTPGQSYLGLIATRGRAPTSFSATFKNANSRSVHTARQDITQIGLSYGGWYLTATGESPMGTTGIDYFQVYAAIEYPLGAGAQTYQVLFRGQALGGGNDFQTLDSDLLNLPITIPKGANFAVRTFWIGGSAGAGICYFDANTRKADYIDGECYEFVTSGGTNRSMATGTFTSTDTTLRPCAGPLAIWGPTTTPSAALVGDSLVESYGDSGVGLYQGVLERALGPTQAFMTLAKSGDLIANLNGSKFNHRKNLINRFATHLFVLAGINDVVTNSIAGDVLFAQLSDFRNKFPNKYFYGCTLPPKSTSTDNWATTGNQTTDTQDPKRQFFNQLLRSNPGLFDGVYDLVTGAEYLGNSGKWIPGQVLVGDQGLHPSPQGYVDRAAIISGNLPATLVF